MNRTKSRPIDEKDKWLIMQHIEELFNIGYKQRNQQAVEAVPITEEDKKLIMENIDELFRSGRKQFR